MPRRQHVTVLMIIVISAFLGIFFVGFFRSLPIGTRHPDFAPSHDHPSAHVAEGTLLGEAKAPKLENATLKYGVTLDAL